MSPHFLNFAGVTGYKTYEAAFRRGSEVASKRMQVDYRWVVIALPSGRFTPMALLNSTIPGGPGMFIGERNFCVAN